VNHTDPAPPETRPRLAPDAATLRQHLTSELLPALRGALNQPDLAAYLRLTVTHRRPDHGAGSQIRVDTPSDAPVIDRER